MGVMMKLKGLKELGQGKWEYRKRVPANAQAAIGRSERKAVIEARTDKELMRKYAAVVAQIDAEIAAAKAPKQKLTPRAAWDAARIEASELSLAVIGAGEVGDQPDAHGFTPDYSRELLAESLIASGRDDPALLRAIMDPNNTHPDNPKPKLTIKDAFDIYVKEKLGGGEGEEQRPAMVRHERVLRLAEAGGLSSNTALVDITREHARKVRDHMLGRERQGGEGEKVSPASVKREIGMLRTFIGYGARELGLKGFDNPFHGLPIEGVSSDRSHVPDREKRDPLPEKIAKAMRGKLQGDLLLIWRILEGTGAHGKEVVGIR